MLKLHEYYYKVKYIEMENSEASVDLIENNFLTYYFHEWKYMYLIFR